MKKIFILTGEASGDKLASEDLPGLAWGQVRGWGGQVHRREVLLFALRAGWETVRGKG